MAWITRAEADEVKKTIVDAETGNASISGLSRAREICQRAGAPNTLAIVEAHAARYKLKEFGRMVAAGLVSGSIVALTVGKWTR